MALAGCGGSSAVDRATIPPCETGFPAKTPADTITVVLFDKVDLSHAPWGQNREERFVFGHLYETLVTIDCHGVVQPALAKSWKQASDGWLFELRDDAHFWDETDVTPQDVRESFQPAIDAGFVIQSVDRVDERRVLVHGLKGAFDIKLIALPMLAVRQTTNGGPPMGTGLWLVDKTVPVDEGFVIRPASGASPVVRFMQGSGSDVRDIMDGTADALITDDPDAVDYARSRDTFSLAPLAWDKAYVLLSTTRSYQIDKGARVANLPAFVCDALAHDAVKVDARGGSTSVREAEALRTLTPIIDRAHEVATGRFNSNQRILCSNGDVTSRNLAERIVALAGMDTTASDDARAVVHAIPGLSRGVRATAVDRAQFLASLARGNEFAYVLPLPLCDFPFSTNALSADWLFYAKPPLSPRIVPLVETRAHFIALTDRVGYLDDRAGNVRVVPSSGVKH